MLQWFKRSLASFLGDKKDVVKNFPLIKKLNEKANIELDSKRSNLLKENFEEILNVVYSSDLEDYNIWLDFGTLLGYYRENDFISHDLDMDFGVQVLSLEEFEVIEKHLINNGFNRTKEFYFNKNLVELSYSYKGLNVDFIIYNKENDRVSSDTIFFMTNALGNPTRYEVYHYEIPFSDLKECDFKGMKVKVPNNTQEYLRTLYGEDFETPNTNYNWKENSIYKPGDATLAEVILHKGK